MSESLHIASDLWLPLNCVTQKFAILGTSGSGKSYTAQKLAELMLDHDAQVIIVDPVGIWWSLRLMADGKHKGYEQVRVFGGDHGDLPLTKESGTLVGRLLAERRISAVLDVSQFLTSEMKLFLTDFAEQFFQSKKSHKSPVHLFLEECQTYLPQNTVDREDAKMLNRWERLIKFFRNYGGGTSMISQQPQSVNKKVLNLADTMFAMRTIGFHERKAINNWVKDVVESEIELVGNLPKLDTGVAHIWSPSWLKISRDVKILKKKTFDAGKTPEMGVDAIEPKPLTPVDVEKLKAEMAEMIERVKQEDPQELRKTIHELRMELRKKPVPTKEGKTTDPKAIERAVAHAVKERDAWIRYANDFIQRIQRDVKELAKHADGTLNVTLKPFTPSLKSLSREAPTATPYRPPPKAVHREPSPEVFSGGESGKLRSGAERMLAALAQWHPGGMSEGQMRSHAGLKKSGTFSAYMSDLRRGEYISEIGGEVYATDTGLEYCKHVPAAPTTTEDVLNVWRPKLRDGARRMLEILVECGGEFISKDELGERAGLQKSGTRSAYLSDLKTARLAITNYNGLVAANKETLFL